MGCASPFLPEVEVQMLAKRSWSVGDFYGGGFRGNDRLRSVILYHSNTKAPPSEALSNCQLFKITSWNRQTTIAPIYTNRVLLLG